MGRALGVTIGCLLGMFPLLFLGGREEEETKTEEGIGDTNVTENEKGFKEAVLKAESVKESVGESGEAAVIAETNVGAAKITDAAATIVMAAAKE